jgi:hypothetical protein
MTQIIDRALVEQALEALERLQNAIYNIGGEHVTGLFVANAAADSAEKPMGTLRAALAQPAPESETAAHGIRTATATRAFTPPHVDATSTFTDGTPEDNKMQWCCYCGKKLVQELITEGTK